MDNTSSQISSSCDLISIAHTTNSSKPELIVKQETTYKLLVLLSVVHLLSFLVQYSECSVSHVM